MEKSIGNPYAGVLDDGENIDEMRVRVSLLVCLGSLALFALLTSSASTTLEMSKKTKASEFN
jgi:hypothetical protein